MPKLVLSKALMQWAVVCLCFFAADVWAATIDGVRLWRAPDHTRIVLDMSGEVSYKLFRLETPDRIVVDIKGARNKASFAKLNYTKTPIKRIRSAERAQKDVRLVFDLSTAVKPRSFFLKPNGGKPHRLVVDLYDQKAVTQKTVAQITQKKQSEKASPAKSESSKNTVKSKKVSRRDIVIVVDAGHGGEDPGASGPKRIREKVVVLDIAKRLAGRINDTTGYRAVLTRRGDYFLPLKKRRDIARKERADLFVSIHADAFKNPQAKGASVFALSQRGATSETARFLAKQENDADLIGGVGDVSLDDKDEVLRGVLVDLSMTATVGASLDVGKQVLGNMGNISHLHKKHVEQAGFLVLKSPDVPSILVETGFISNPHEARKLSTPSYRQRMAAAIFKGINKYFNRAPPAGTYLSWKKNGGKDEIVINSAPKSQKAKTYKGKPKRSEVPSSSGGVTVLTHKVVNGDSLSMIAQKYRVSTTKIKRLNKLKSNSIRIGQVLKISTRSAGPAYAKIHKVTEGETLSGIALRYNTSVNAIRRLNKMSALSILHVGKKLKIPHVKS